jgi:hypothetical protein
MRIDHAKALRLLTVLLGVAILVSVVHYADNYFNYEDFPHGDGPEPSAGLVLAAWFILTPLGIAGWVFFRRGDYATAGLLLMAYSFSGLVGIGHFTVGGMTDEPALRLAHVVADILLGVAIFAFGLRAFLSGRGQPSRQSGAT